LGGLVDFVFLFTLIGAETICDFRLLIMNRRLDWSEARRMVSPRMLDDVVTESVMIYIAFGFSRLGRLKAHVVPAEILEATAPLAEALGPHGRARGALAGEKTGGQGSERLGFSGHLLCPLTGRQRGGQNRRPDADWPQ